MKLKVLATVAALLLTSTPGMAQTPAGSAAAMDKLAFMHGVWVGPASGVNRDGSRYAVTQTERIGPLLGGEVLVIEGRGYNADGSTGFNAMGVVSWNEQEGRYEFRSWAQGQSGTFPFTLTENGYVWEIPAGPGVMRYTADVTTTTYHEVGEFVVPGQPGRPMFEMTLTRRGDTDWPASGAVQP
ncbi:hypothetical protein GGQ87_000315 [Brevundimonas alba]|uniref:DUF1579 domain-containing protein n=1 Tax=Brevundimonas alba TaxID=74314 RepID=A0A7X6BM81_9CAUL|nr:DUF1579 domain-containing protein [Brevundimonas alba]NJC40057.1 hypothetical protein [Brevundimonas alba]